ncbi:MAG: fimbrillin family protein, partial [Bacteroidales bacterium]
EDNKGGQIDGNGRSTLVTFNASIEGRNITRAMSPMKTGIQSQIFAYDANHSDPINQSFADGTYITTSPGVLAGNNGYKMYLPNGIYDFYAVSDNYSTIPPSFINGESEFLFDGIDYLWWKSKEQDVTSSQINMPIIFLHAATQIVFNVTEGEGIQLQKLLFAHITPPIPGAKMNLSTGVIPPATEYGKADKMGINSFTAQYIMLPIQTTTPMTLTLEVMVDNESVSRIYTVNVPVPNGELKAGNSYLFEAVIDGNSISFPTV